MYTKYQDKGLGLVLSHSYKSSCYIPNMFFCVSRPIHSSPALSLAIVGEPGTADVRFGKEWYRGE